MKAFIQKTNFNKPFYLFQINPLEKFELFEIFFFN